MLVSQNTGETYFGKIEPSVTTSSLAIGDDFEAPEHPVKPMADEQTPKPKEPHPQRYTGPKAQRIERMRRTLWNLIETKGKLDRDVLIAMKMLMELDGIHGEKVPALGGKQRGRKPKALRSVIKVPALLESA